MGDDDPIQPYPAGKAQELGAGLSAGHTSVVTVLDRYGHVLPGGEARVNDALDALAADAIPTPDAQVVSLSRDGRGMDAASSQVSGL